MIETFEVDLPHGVRLACRAAGLMHAPLLVFLHGFPEAAFVWDQVIDRLADRYRCVAPNLRGYGGSTSPTEVESYRPKHLMHDMDALITVLGGRAEAVVAHDWGGAVAWNLAAQQPRCLRRLVIVNSPHPATFLRELQHNAAQQEASAYMNFLVRPDAAKLLAENDFARLWRFFETWGDGDSKHAAPGWLDEPTREQFREVWRRGLDGPLNFYRASPLRPPSADDRSVLDLRLPDSAVTVNVPTLVVWGESDRALLPGLLEGLETFVTDLRIERWPLADHWLIHECPDRLADEVAGFVAVQATSVKPMA